MMLKLKTLFLCARSWKILSLLEEYKLEYTIEQMPLNTNQTLPIIDDCPSDLSYIFLEFDFFTQNIDKKKFGYWTNIVDCNMIPDIIEPIKYERVLKPLINRVTPDLNILKEKRIKLRKLLDEISHYLEENTWLDTNYFSISDILLSTAIAVLDYLGEMPWKEYEAIYNWYLKIKSRPSFQIILKQLCPGIKAHQTFKQIDF